MRAKMGKIKRDGLKVIIDLCPFATEANQAEIERFVRLEGKKVQISIDDKTEKSREANGYMWVLCDELAKVIGGTKEGIYRLAVKDAGVWEDVTVDADRAVRLSRGWSTKGIGWMAEKVDADAFGNITVRLYYGSSMYTSRELGRLIDWLVDECKWQGIETKEQAEIDSLLERWAVRHG